MGLSTQINPSPAPPQLAPFELSFTSPLAFSRGHQFLDHEKEYGDCKEHILRAEAILTKDPVAAEKLLRKAFSQTQKSGYSDLATQVCLLLPSLLAASPGLVRKYAGLKRTFEAQYQAECEIQGYYFHLLQELAKKEAHDLGLMLKLEEYHAAGEALFRQFPTSRMRLYSTLIGLLMYTRKKDLQATLRLCQISRVTFEGTSGQFRKPLSIIYYHCLICMVIQKMYTDGCKIADKGQAIFTPGSLCWFAFRELFVLLQSNTGHYEKAYKHVKQSIKLSAFDQLPEAKKENWLIFKAYLLFVRYFPATPTTRCHLLTALKRLKQESQSVLRPSQRAPFVLHLLTALITFLTRQYGQLRELVQLLQDQKQQYTLLYRSAFCVIDIFQALIDHNFQAKEVRMQERAYLRQLKSGESRYGSLESMLQVIPIENLWVSVLLILENES